MFILRKILLEKIPKFSLLLLNISQNLASYRSNRVHTSFLLASLPPSCEHALTISHNY